VVVPEEGVQRRADHLAGAAHHPFPCVLANYCS
jgi:hypothetical protein